VRHSQNYGPKLTIRDPRRYKTYPSPTCSKYALGLSFDKKSHSPSLWPKLLRKHY